jgi:p-aminobenzoyl-glutamate transporter AbgT
MIGAIEILIIAIIFGIIYGRDAIDKTFKKHADENLAESFAVDVKDFYEKDPKRLILLVAGGVAAFAFIGVGIYWALTRTDILKTIGLE